jgi:hypothetical protein
MANFNDTLIERFWPKVDKKGPIPKNRPDLGPCWIWTGSISNQNTKNKRYGNIYAWGKGRRAHRVAYRLFIEEFDENLKICHHCDNPTCVNPKHLFLGTQKDNVRDCLSKGRAEASVGRKNANKERCIHGHEFTKENTYFRPLGGRSCIACEKIRQAKKPRKERTIRPKKIVCPKGHSYQGYNLMIDYLGNQRCRACSTILRKNREAKTKARSIS